MCTGVQFPYALWRDFVSDLIIIAGDATFLLVSIRLMA
jgi:hypothetical protein